MFFFCLFYQNMLYFDSSDENCFQKLLSEWHSQISYWTETLIRINVRYERSVWLQPLEVDVPSVKEHFSMRTRKEIFKFRYRKSPFSKNLCLSMYFTWSTLIRNIFSLAVVIRNTVPNKNKRNIFKDFITYPMFSIAIKMLRNSA